MGAIHFSLDPILASSVARALGLDVFFESGTFEGASIEVARSLFEEIYSVELSPEYHSKAAERFADYPQIHLIQGDSPGAIRELRPRLAGRRVLYWLDAHWCQAKDTAGKASQCPLLAEIEAIGPIGSHSVIMIDDARLFLCCPPHPHEISQWPAFHQVLAALQKNSPEAQVAVVNDVIVCHPESAAAVIRDHAHTHGFDLLHLAHQARSGEVRGVEMQQQLAGLQLQTEASKSDLAAMASRHEKLRRRFAAVRARRSEASKVASSLRQSMDELRKKVVSLELELSRERSKRLRTRLAESLAAMVGKR